MWLVKSLILNFNEGDLGTTHMLLLWKGQTGKAGPSGADLGKSGRASVLRSCFVQVHILLLLPSSCVSLDKIQNFAELLFPSLKSKH